MVKKLKKPHKSLTNTINSILPPNKTIPKSKQQIDQEYYQKNKEWKKEQQRERYAKQKEQEQLSAQKFTKRIVLKSY